jgi:hypothetical protein
LQQYSASKHLPCWAGYAVVALTAICAGVLALIPGAAADETTEQGPRSKIRVRCGTLADKQGEQVLGRGSVGTDTQRDAAYCPSNDRPSRKIEPQLPVAAEKPASVPASPPVAVSPRPVSRARQVAPAARAVQPIQVASGWEAGEEQRLDRFAPSHAERLSAALVSGGVLWFLHSSFWASMLLLGFPLWRHVDLLAIVARVDSASPTDSAALPTREDAAVAGVLAQVQRPHSHSSAAS